MYTKLTKDIHNYPKGHKITLHMQAAAGDLLMRANHVIIMYMQTIIMRTLVYLLHPMAAYSLGAQLAVLLKVHP